MIPIDVVAAVDRWAVATPDRAALESEGRTLTYGALADGARAVAGFIAAQRVTPGAPILVRGHKEPEMLVGFLGCLLAGHPYVPVDSAIPDVRVQRIIALARASLVLDPSQIARIVRQGGTAVPVQPAGEQLQYIMFTSGSTGDPKGVPITRANLEQFVGWMVEEHGFAPGGERFLDQAVYSFDLSVMSVYPALVTGGTLVSLTREDVADPRRAFRILANADLTTWVSTPTFAQFCLTERRFDAAMLPRLARLLFCGETLAPGTAETLLKRFPAAEVWNTYGPTETTVATTSVRVDQGLLHRYPALPVGRPAPGCQVVVVDDQLVSQPAGERGEILVVGPNVSPGYLHAPELTGRAFVRWNGQWAYRTGDRGHVQDGLLFFDGRQDDQIKLHGYRIELGDVEAQLRAVPGVQHAAAVVVPRNGLPHSLAAFVVLDSPASDRASDITASVKARLAERLPGYMIPRRIFCLDALPMTANGKLDRQALAQMVR